MQQYLVSLLCSTSCQGKIIATAICFRFTLSDQLLIAPDHPNLGEKMKLSVDRRATGDFPEALHCLCKTIKEAGGDMSSSSFSKTKVKQLQIYDSVSVLLMRYDILLNSA